MKAFWLVARITAPYHRAASRTCRPRWTGAADVVYLAFTWALSPRLGHTGGHGGGQRNHLQRAQHTTTSIRALCSSSTKRGPSILAVPLPSNRFRAGIADGDDMTACLCRFNYALPYCPLLPVPALFAAGAHERLTYLRSVSTVRLVHPTGSRVPGTAFCCTRAACSARHAADRLVSNWF